MKIMVINGPNINMIGIREKNIYGTISFDEIIRMINDEANKRGIEVKCLQSNYEGQLVTWIQDAYFENYDGIIINPGAYTHTSIAIADAIKAIAPIPVVEIHLSDIDSREEFRKISYLTPYCIAQIKGHKHLGYIEALDTLKEYINQK
ncbi:MAG: type II 3-dehydroquinate dehydratase [Firmicutes bacterium]|nr:type II 3-dehydroquinate dehydratase [Bacillota bacterium]MDY3091676.1 type II 3-dehydroquinate dehydratase [Erysipelotrichaceae bacterium]